MYLLDKEYCLYTIGYDWFNNPLHQPNPSAVEISSDLSRPTGPHKPPPSNLVRTRFKQQRP